MNLGIGFGLGLGLAWLAMNPSEVASDGMSNSDRSGVRSSCKCCEGKGKVGERKRRKKRMDGSSQVERVARYRKMDR